MLRKLRLGESEKSPEMLLDQLNQAFWSVFEDNRLLNEEEKEPEQWGHYVKAQRLYHNAGLVIIGEIAAQMPTGDSGGMEPLVEENASLPIEQTEGEQKDEPMQGAEDEQPILVQSPQYRLPAIQFDSDLLVVNQPSERAPQIFGLAENNEPATVHSTGAIPKVRAVETEDEVIIELQAQPLPDMSTLPYSHYERLMRPFLNLPRLEGEPSERSLEMFRDAINQALNRAGALHVSLEPQTKMFVALIQHKLDSTSRQLWAWQMDGKEPNFDDMLEFLAKRMSRMRDERANNNNEIGAGSMATNARRIDEPVAGPSGAGSSSVSKKKRVVCSHCGSDHYLHRCEMFKCLSLPAKMAVLKRNNLCLNCFSATHKTGDCKQGVCKRCNLKHNSLLCSKLESNN